MTDNELLENIYFKYEYDFTNIKDCDRLKQNNMNLKLMDKPFFTFMMATFNNMELLNASVNSLLRQEFQNWELIILDNSTINNKVWETIVRMMQADSRIHGIKSERNVGWPKGASICLGQAKGEYATFLAADDCINDGALMEMYKVLSARKPDVLWVGNAFVEVDFEHGFIRLQDMVLPDYREYWKDTRSETIVQLVNDLCYFSFFHYMRIEFLKEQGIDFFEPYYADCAGMAQAMAVADRMVVLDLPVYFLTTNTSQTSGTYTWDSYDFMFANQWRSVCAVLKRDGYDNVDGMRLLARRFLGELLDNIMCLTRMRCRDKYMNPVSKSVDEIVVQLEQIMGNEAILEMLQCDAQWGFQMLLERLELLKVEQHCFSRSVIGPLLQLAHEEKNATVEEKLILVMEWLLADYNPCCLGFEYFSEWMEAVGDEFIVRSQTEISKVVEKYKRYLQKAQQDGWKSRIAAARG